MTTSYISEHSAEYYLVPALKNILQEQYSHIAPVFPWISREFSNISKYLHKEDRFHVLVMFPRRPKINIPDDWEVYFTINEELDDCNNYAWVNLSQINYYEYLNPVSNLKKNGCLLEKEDILFLVRNSAIFNLESFEDFFRYAKETQPDRMYGSQYKPVYFLIKTP